MLVLPPSVQRVLQLIFDGHGFLSRSGAVRSPHSIRDHNATRYARDPLFFIGTNKHQYLEKAVQIGGEDSLSAHMYAGLRVTERKPEDLPAHVRAAAHFLAAARIECARACCMMPPRMILHMRFNLDIPRTKSNISKNR